MKKIKFLMIAALMSTAAIFQQCNNDDDNNNAADITEQEEAQIAETSNEGDNTVEEDIQYFDLSLSDNASSGGRAQSTCVNITNNEGTKTVTLDFGNGCVGPYGRQRSGKVFILYGGTFGDSLANRTITFENYVVNNKKISGTIELRDFNRNSDGNLTSTRKLTAVTITYANGETLTLNGTTTREWLEGEGDKIWENDVFKLTGYYEGVSTTGRSFKHTIIEPIISDFSCRAQGGFLRVSGSTEMVITGLVKTRTRTVNYGNGDCDDTFTITINSKLVTVIAGNS